MSLPSLSPSLHGVRNGRVQKKTEKKTVRFGKENICTIPCIGKRRSSKGLSPCTKMYMRLRYNKPPPSPNHKANRRWLSEIELPPVYLVAHHRGDPEDKQNDLRNVELITIPGNFWDEDDDK